MTNEDIIKSINVILQEIFELPDLSISAATSAADIDEWDSMTHIQIIAAIEGKYKVRFALGELQALKNVGDMIELIQKKLSK